ncbi:MAG TPA: non-ribosomal peptide synthetase [Streptosporangiaceae bacterium]|nr:non-ribosomal peptide synthetase [Streptosporangiaceae bacterium]
MSTSTRAGELRADGVEGHGLSGAAGARRELPGLTVMELIAGHADRAPEAAAVTGGGPSLTYGELLSAASWAAAGLSARGVTRGQVVAVVTGRSSAAVVAMMAVWWAGAVYLPIDPTYPAQRITLLLDDTAAAAVLTEPRFLATIPAGRTPVVTLDAAATERPPPMATSPEDAAYIIYTSGSTGTPKGVVVGHRSLLNVVLEMAAAMECGAADQWLTMAPTTFDISLLELCVPLVSGGRLVISTEAQLRDAAALVRLVRGWGITRMQAVPSQWRMLLDAGFGAPGMVAMVGGEALSTALARALRRRVRVLLNGYGPTETAVVSSFWRVPETPARIAIGGPIANTRMYLLDDALVPVLPGQPGELYIAGAGLAQGYLNRPGLTGQRFPTVRGERMYRTGDRCRWRSDGMLEYLGRTDDQVKIRGQRIELGEVEACLCAHPTVAAVAALTHSDALIAYVVAAGGTVPDPADLRAYAAQALPAGAVPNKVVVLPGLPLTPHGKVDKAALRAIGATGEPVTHHGTDPWLASICEMCREVLSVPAVRPADDIFELGAHSLTVMQFAARIQAAWDIEVPAAVFYEAATVGDIAEAVARLTGRP